MKRTWWLGLSCVLILALVAPFAAGCDKVQAAEGYVVLVPRTLHSGSEGSVSFNLYGSGGPVRDRVEVRLLQGSREIAKSNATVDGKGVVVMAVPDVDEGEYTVVVKGTGFEQRTPVRIDRTPVLFLETDKPIYKPGQTIHMRVLTLDSELKPVRREVTIEVLDAKGIKLLRTVAQADEYGMVNLDLPLADELNLGTWEIQAEADNSKTQLDVRVERYVLPKYDVNVDLTREWFLVNDEITGVVSSEYSFGKPVKGEMEIVASRYVGQWEEYATFRTDIDGKADFRIPAANYVAGVPEAGGQGNVMLDITVVEDVTGYVERTSRLLTVADSPVNLQLIPEGSVFKPGLPFSFLVITETPDNQPIDAKVQVEVTFLDKDFKDVKTVKQDVKTKNGTALFSVDPPADAVALSITAQSEGKYVERVMESSY
ncbi:MAG: alpha-2-macroglobulin, partial [Dehalococcoidia bacterium]